MHFGCCRGRCWWSGGATLSPRWQHRLLPLQQTQNLYRDQDKGLGEPLEPMSCPRQKERWPEVDFLFGRTQLQLRAKLCSCSHTCPIPNFFDLSPKTDNSPTGMAALVCWKQQCKIATLKSIGWGSYLCGRCQG